MKRKERYKILVIILTLVLTGCKKFVEVNAPSNKLVSSTVFLNESTATAAVTGIYAKMINNVSFFATGGSTQYLGMYADELRTTITSVSTLEFEEGNLSVNNGIVFSNFWRSAYDLVYSANSCITGLQNSPVAPQLRDQLLGEAYFIRAFCYWNLVVNFGDVPLVLTVEDYKSTSLMSRNKSSEIIQNILADLDEAKKLLKSAYPTSGRIRPNYFTACALISRINLYLGNWGEVISNSNEILSQSNYSLETDINKIFLIGSTEAIWQLTSDAPTITNSADGSLFIPASISIPPYIIQPSLLNAFTSSDKRKANWITVKTVSGISYTYPFKYKVRLNATKTEAQMMFRLGEIYLNRAEAKAKLNDPTAIDDLNRIRLRAGLLSLNNISGDSLLTAIRQERRLELFAECGLRWFDLKRNSEIDQVNSQIKNGWKAEKRLFPIPNSEILVAPNLIQNPGYN